jgi:hypothetical protein
MKLEEVRRMQAEKDHLARYEGKHPANYNELDRAMFGHVDGEMHGVDPNSHGVELQ